MIDMNISNIIESVSGNYIIKSLKESSVDGSLTTYKEAFSVDIIKNMSINEGIVIVDKLIKAVLAAYKGIKLFLAEFSENIKNKLDLIFSDYSRFIDNHKEDIHKGYEKYKNELKINSFTYFYEFRKINSFGFDYISNVQTGWDKVKAVLFAKFKFSDNNFSTLSSIKNYSVENLKILDKELVHLSSAENLERAYKVTTKKLIDVECANENEFTVAFRKKLRGADEPKIRLLKEYPIDNMLNDLKNYKDTISFITNNIKIAQKTDGYVKIITDLLAPTNDDKMLNARYEVIQKIEHIFKRSIRFTVAYYTTVLSIEREKKSLFINICKKIIENKD